MLLSLRIFSRKRLTALDSATSSARVGGSSSRFHRVRISVLMDSFFSISKIPSST